MNVKSNISLFIERYINIIILLLLSGFSMQHHVYSTVDCKTNCENVLCVCPCLWEWRNNLPQVKATCATFSNLAFDIFAIQICYSTDKVVAAVVVVAVAVVVVDVTIVAATVAMAGDAVKWGQLSIIS